MRSGRGRGRRPLLNVEQPAVPIGRAEGLTSDSGIDSGSGPIGRNNRLDQRHNRHTGHAHGQPTTLPIVAERSPPRVPLTTSLTASPNIQKVDYEHKMPQSGDQGVKPESEKLWPEIWHGEGENPSHGVSPFSESGRFKILEHGTKINLHKTQSFKFSGRRKVEDVAIKEAEQDIARNLQLQGTPFLTFSYPVFSIFIVTFQFHISILTFQFLTFSF